MDAEEKTWVKPTQIVADIGPCKYCKDMVNTESFVAVDKNKVHYEYKKDDEKSLVWVGGFEPPIPWSQTRCDTGSLHPDFY